MPFLETYRLASHAPGPSVLLLGAVHGDEVCGTQALQRLLHEAPRLACGQVTIVPICNPEAHRQGRRFVDKNLNRVIGPHAHPVAYEEHVAGELIPLLESHDVLLDIHSFSAEGRPFLFLDYDTPANRRFAEALDVPEWVVGWPALYAATPELNEGDTISYAQKTASAELLIECGQHQSPEAPALAYRTIRRALHHFGLLSDPDFTPPRSPSPYRMTQIVQRTATQGQMARAWQHLDPVRAGDSVIIYDDGTVLKAPFDGVIMLPNAQASVGAEWLYFGRKDPG